MDEADRAQIYEEQARERGVLNTRQPTETPLIINGIRHCIDCEDEINTKRVNLIDAVRCQYCQSDLEKRRTYNG